MEYSKEDLMEAKKQIWGVGENMGTEESKKIWEENAQFWDNAMGVLLQCLFDRFGSVFPQCGLMVFPGAVIVSR